MKSPRDAAGRELAGSTVKLWDAATGALRATWPLQPDNPQFHGMRYVLNLLNPNNAQNRPLDGDLLARTSIALHAIQGAGVKGMEGSLWPLAFSPDGSLLVAGTLDGTARLWNTRTGKPVATLSGHGGRISGITFTSDSKQVITSKGSPFAPQDMIDHSRASAARTPHEGEIRFWDVQTGELLRTIQTGPYTIVTTVAVSPDGALLAAHAGSHPFLFGTAPQPLPIPAPETMGIRIYDLPTGRVLRIILEERIVHRLVFTPDGNTLAGSTFSSLFVMGDEAKDTEDVRLWDVAAGKLRLALKGIGNATAVAVSPDGKTIAACRGDLKKWDGEWMLWNTANGQPKGNVPLDYPLLSVAFAPDGKTLATAGGPLPGIIKQWSTTTGEALPWQPLTNEQ